MTINSAAPKQRLPAPANRHSLFVPARSGDEEHRSANRTPPRARLTPPGTIVALRAQCTEPPGVAEITDR